MWAELEVMTPGVLDWATKHLRLIPDGDILEIGSLNVNGGVAQLLNGTHRYTGLDLVGGPGVDVVADACDYIEDDSWDAILAFDAMEHDAHWWVTAQAIACGLRCGGRAIVCVPDITYPVHHEPDYYRWTAAGAAQMLLPLRLTKSETIQEMVTDNQEHRSFMLRHHITVWEKS
jgi:hypothetical protein